MTRLSDHQSAPRRRDRIRSVGFRPTLERLPVLRWHDGDEETLRSVPPPQLTFRASAAGVTCVLLHQSPQQRELAGVSHVRQLHHPLVALPLQLLELVEYECDATTHSRAEVSAGAAKHDDRAASHVLAAVIADSFHHRDRATVAHAESLASDSGEVSFTRRRAVEHRVSDEDRLVRNEL